VQRYKALFREGVVTVSRQMLTITSIAGLYFGLELGGPAEGQAGQGFQPASLIHILEIC
jgi:hypothetical protein